ncbi:MAG: hypothetical protein AAGE52_40140 [Myxococcota bacterium]
MRAKRFASRGGPRVPGLMLLMLLFASAGCKVTAEDIEYWKGTVKGPGKIVAVLLAERYPMELRGQAALALVEMERNDVNGVGELQRAIQQIQSTNPETAQAIIDGMVPGLKEMMRGGDDANQNEDLGPPLSQMRAKDAAYLLIANASPTARQELMSAVVGWYTVDFAERSLAGDYSVEQVVRSLGAPAATLLVDAMNSHQPQQALVKIAELINQLGSEETKARAGTRIVEIQREMEGSEFLDWLKSKIRESLESQNREANDDRITAIATLNRENFINDGALTAMKHLAGQAPVRDRLLEIANAAPAADAPDFARDSLNLRRRSALQALEGNATEAQLQALLNIALSESNPIDVRDYAFDRVGDVRSRAAIPRLWPLLEEDDNDVLKKRLRWRAGELILAIGGSEIVGEFLSRLPSDNGVKFEPEELEGYATRMSTMTPQPMDTMERQLRSPRWYNRIIALRFIERRGTQVDVSKMRRLLRDSASTVGDGWAGRELPSVGKVAENAIAALEERLAGPSAEGEQPAQQGAN